MAASGPPDLLKSPLAEFCERKLKEFTDFDVQMTQPSVERVREICNSPDSDGSDECIVRVSSPPIYSDSESGSSRPTTTSYGTDKLLSDGDWRDSVSRTLQFLHSDLEKTPLEEQPNKFVAFLEKHKKSGSSSLSDKAKRFRDFLMFTTVKEYILSKWSKLKGPSHPPIESKDTKKSG